LSVAQTENERYLSLWRKAGAAMLDMKYARFDEAVIKRCAKDKRIGYLYSDKHPTLRLRFLNDRRRVFRLGVWEVLHRDEWHRVGDYPELDCATMLACLRRVVQQLRRGYTVFDDVVSAVVSDTGLGEGQWCWSVPVIDAGPGL
jgi:hypothetical protein